MTRDPARGSAAGLYFDPLPSPSAIRLTTSVLRLTPSRAARSTRR